MLKNIKIVLGMLLGRGRVPEKKFEVKNTVAGILSECKKDSDYISSSTLSRFAELLKPITSIYRLDDIYDDCPNDDFRDALIAHYKDVIEEIKSPKELLEYFNYCNKVFNPIIRDRFIKVVRKIFDLEQLVELLFICCKDELSGFVSEQYAVTISYIKSLDKLEEQYLSCPQELRAIIENHYAEIIFETGTAELESSEKPKTKIEQRVLQIIKMKSKESGHAND